MIPEPLLYVIIVCAVLFGGIRLLALVLHLCGLARNKRNAKASDDRIRG